MKIFQITTCMLLAVAEGRRPSKPYSSASKPSSSASKPSSSSSYKPSSSSSSASKPSSSASKPSSSASKPSSSSSYKPSSSSSSASKPSSYSSSKPSSSSVSKPTTSSGNKVSDFGRIKIIYYFVLFSIATKAFRQPWRLVDGQARPKKLLELILLIWLPKRLLKSSKKFQSYGLGKNSILTQGSRISRWTILVMDMKATMNGKNILQSHHVSVALHTMAIIWPVKDQVQSWTWTK